MPVKMRLKCKLMGGLPVVLCAFLPFSGSNLSRHWVLNATHFQTRRNLSVQIALPLYRYLEVVEQLRPWHWRWLLLCLSLGLIMWLVSST